MTTFLIYVAAALTETGGCSVFGLGSECPGRRGGWPSACFRRPLSLPADPGRQRPAALAWAAYIVSSFLWL